MIENFSPKAPQTAQKEFSLIPEGLYQVSVHDIVEKQKPDFKNPEVLKNVLTFTFIILNEGELRGRRLWLDVNALAPFPPYQGRKQSWMHKVVSAIEKHSITEAEASTFTTDKFNALIGKQLQAVVKHSPPKASGKIYANIESVMASTQELPEYEKKKTIEIDGEDAVVPF